MHKDDDYEIDLILDKHDAAMMPFRHMRLVKH